MTIGFIGNFEAEFSTENYHLKTFNLLGHDVICFQENKTTTKDILLRLRDMDILFWTHTHGWHIGKHEAIRLMLGAFKSEGKPTVGYHLDLWLGLEREKDLANDAYWTIEHFFTVDKLMADWINVNTATKGYYLPAAIYEADVFRGTFQKELATDILFTGAYNYHKEHGYRKKLIDWLHYEYGDHFHHYGNTGRAIVRGHKLNDLLASSKITIGDTLCKNFTYPYYFSDRLFETIGRGGFMIFPYIKGLEDMFEIGKEIITYDFGNFDHLKELIAYYLKHEDERNAIIDAGIDRVSNDHTYTKRIQTILSRLQ